MELEDTTFKDGDLVRMKSGGPVMVVQFLIGPFLFCTWTDAFGSTRRANFAPGQLELVQPRLSPWVTVAARLGWHRPVHICIF